MTANLGSLLFILATVSTGLLALVPVYERCWKQVLQSGRWFARLVWFQFLCLAGAMGALVYAMANLDFSLQYVFEQTNTLLPVIYRITGTWGGHAGSLLLWTTIVSAWMLVPVLRRKTVQSEHGRLTVAIMAMVSLGFQVLLWLSSPFKVFSGGVPLEGRGLNPMLQDIGLAIHPPTLYIGYGGIVAVFAMIVATLWLKQPVRQSLGMLQKTARVAWAWLTLGIALGSWWAYLELGWGGWWFWDPVENASLMPWLTLTAMLHGILLSYRGRRVGLAISTLATSSLGLMLMGMFIVRSGVMTSVHAFSSSPTQGMTILSFMLLTTLGGFAVQAFRPPVEEAPCKRLLSRVEVGLLAVIVILVMACATVLLGTLYPIILEVMDMGRISVGPPYFNTFFVPLTLASAAVLVASEHIRWPVLLVLTAIAASLALVADWQLTGTLNSVFVVSLILAALVMLVSVYNAVRTGRLRPGHIAHIGLAFAILGAAISSEGTHEQNLRMRMGQTTDVGQYSFQFTGTTPRFGPNYLTDFGFVDIYRSGSLVTTVHPEKRLYSNFGQVMTEVGYDAGLKHDFYAVLGEPFADGSWAVRLKVIPFISLLWLGAALMVLSGTGLSVPVPRLRRAEATPQLIKR